MGSFLVGLLSIMLMLNEIVWAEEYFNDDLAEESYPNNSSEEVSHNTEPKGEQLALRINEQGLKKIMLMAMKYNSTVPGGRTINIPADFYKFTLKKNTLLSNPVVKILNDVSNLSLNKDFNFFLKTSPISITGMLNEKSLRVKMSNTNLNGFDVYLSFSLSQLILSSDSLSLCEDQKRNKCGEGVKFTAQKIKIKTVTNPLRLTAMLRVSNKSGFTGVKILSVGTNLEGADAPDLDIGLGALTIPPISILINDQETVIDTAGIKDRVLEQKVFLGKKLLSFAADFMANDFAEMINIYLVNNQVPTSWKVYTKNQENFRELKFNEEIYRPQLLSPAQYMRPKIYSMSIDNTYVQKPLRTPPIDYMQIIINQMEQAIQHADVEVSLSSLRTPLNKDIELGVELDFMLNNRSFVVGKALSNNPKKTLPPLSLDAHRANDINLVISEPLLNGSLDLITSTGLFQEVFQALLKIPEIALDKEKAVRLHFTNRKTLVAVANVSLDLKKIRSSFLENPKKWATNKLAKIIESINNTTIIKFPVEFEVVPTVRPEKCGLDYKPKSSAAINSVPSGTKASNFIRPSAMVSDNTYVKPVDMSRYQADIDAMIAIQEECLSARIKTPFSGDKLINTYGYYTNVDAMTSMVRSGVIDEIKEALKSVVDKDYPIDLKKFMNQSGVVFTPKGISFDQSAYMVLNLDIVDIKFNKYNPNAR